MTNAVTRGTAWAVMLVVAAVARLVFAGAVVGLDAPLKGDEADYHAIAVNVLHGVRHQDDPKRFEELKAEVERDTSAWGLAELYEAQSVIDPRETREYLKRTLEVHRLRMKNGVGEHLLRNWPTSY